MKRTFTEDFLNAPETPGDDITTFVYIYPEYELAGYYSGGAKAYATYSMAKIYDLKNKVRYEPIVADTSEPLEYVYTDGNVDRIKAPMNEIGELNFLRGLQ